MISKDLAGRIASAAINHSFQADIDREQKEEARLAHRVYVAIFPKAERDLAASLPKRWVVWASAFCVNADGYSITLATDEPLPVPSAENQWNAPRIGTVSGDLSKAVRDFAEKKETARLFRKKAKADLSASIVMARSFKKLADVWPEGLEFFKEFADAEQRRGTALAIPFEDINKTLGLKRQKKAA